MIFFLLLSTLLSLTAARDDLCSSENTSSQSPTTSQYMTDGLCITTCQSSFAYGIVAGNQCWCTNVAPATAVDISECSDPCIGYPKNQCGNVAQGLLRYVQIGIPTATAQLPSTAQPSTSQPSTSQSSTSQPSTSQPSTSQSSTSQSSTSQSSTSQPSTSPPSSRTSSSSKSSSKTTSSSSKVSELVSTVFLTATSTLGSSFSTPSSSSSSFSSSSSSSSGSQSPIISIVTVFTAPTTQVVQPSSTAAASQPPTIAASADTIPVTSSFFNDSGKVAAVFTIVGVVIAVIIGLITFFLFRRRRRNRNMAAEDRAAFDTPWAGAASRGNSKSKHRRSSSGAMLTDEKGSPHITRTPSEEASTPVDQRLDPRSFVMRFDSNYSQSSLRDEEDYSRRVLHVANPDHE